MDTHALTSSVGKRTGDEQAETASHVTADVSLRKAAGVAGLGLLVMAVLAGAMVAAFENLIVSEDAATTARNIADHELLLRGIICGFLIVAVLDVVVAWALYVLLRPVNRSVALLSAWFRVVYAAIFVAALSNLVVAVRLLSGADSVQAFGTGQLNAQVLMSVHAFNDGWDAALAIFGVHLFVLGYLIFTSRYIPGVLGVLVMIASVGYLMDSVGGFLSTGYNANVGLVTPVAEAVGEVLLMGWLLWKGVWLRKPASA